MRLSDIVDVLQYLLVLVASIGIIVGIVVASVGTIRSEESSGAMIPLGIGAAALCLVVCHVAARRLEPREDA